MESLFAGRRKVEAGCDKERRGEMRKNENAANNCDKKKRWQEEVGNKLFTWLLVITFSLFLLPYFQPGVEAVFERENRKFGG